MRRDSEPASLPNRRSLRLSGYDYTSPGGYFITLCTLGGQSLFGQSTPDGVALNECGKVVKRCWLEIPQHFPSVALDAFVVMPNHLHGIFLVRLGAETEIRAGPWHLGTVVAAFKSAAAKEVGPLIAIPSRAVWQRGYYEHIIRNDIDLDRIRQYIADNAFRWADDPENEAGGPVVRPYG